MQMTFSAWILALLPVQTSVGSPTMIWVTLVSPA